MSLPLLQLDKVSFQVSGRQQPLLNQICYQVEPGDFVVILGGNGSGKSTLVKVINGIYPSYQGEVMLSGKSLKALGKEGAAKSIITLTQSAIDNLFPEMSVFENAILWEMRADIDKKPNRLELANYFEEFHPRLPKLLDTPVYQLSGGEQQILLLALALRFPPTLLLLDEHTSALDPKMAESMMEKTYEAVTKRQITCLMTTHHLEFALRYGNRLIGIREGEIAYQAQGQKKKALTRESLMENCYS